MVDVFLRVFSSSHALTDRFHACMHARRIVVRPFGAPSCTLRNVIRAHDDGVCLGYLIVLFAAYNYHLNVVRYR